VSISADLLEILACPSTDHAPLRLETSVGGVEELVCTWCLSRFPVSDGIAVLLADEAVPGPNGLGNPASEPTAGAPPSEESAETSARTAE
jgi:uncharacterized protein YbaR (Trm112 family)